MISKWDISRFLIKTLIQTRDIFYWSQKWLSEWQYLLNFPLCFSLYFKLQILRTNFQLQCSNPFSLQPALVKWPSWAARTGQLWGVERASTENQSLNQCKNQRKTKPRLSWNCRDQPVTRTGGSQLCRQERPCSHSLLGGSTPSRHPIAKA